MLHEILMALLGHPGSLISNTGNSFSLSESIDFLSKAEIDLINKIAALGWDYLNLSKFVSLSSQPLGIHEEFSDDSDPSSTIYVRAFSYGVDELLQLYREHILALEHEYLLERALTIPHLIHRLGIFFQLFPALSKCVNSISEQKLKGGQVLDLLYEMQQSGNPAVRKMFCRIVKHCLKVMYEQINAWAVYGIILDETEEFFVQRIYAGEKELAQALEKQNANQNSMNASMISMASNLSVKQTQKQFSASEIEAEEWNTAYKLRLPMLATNYVSVELAEKILFIGKVVRVLQSKRIMHSKEAQLLTVTEMQIFSQAFHRLVGLPEFDKTLFEVFFYDIKFEKESCRTS